MIQADVDDPSVFDGGDELVPCKDHIGKIEQKRADAYKKMTKIFLEHFPWIPVIQPYEDYGMQKYVEWTPDPLQQLEIRRFNFKFRRA